MQDIFVRYHGLGPDLGSGKGRDTPRASQGGILAWHFGVGLKSGRKCSEAPRLAAGQGLEASKLGSLVVGRDATWAGHKGMRFDRGGRLQTPWGGGFWGRLRDTPETLFVDFMGQQHVIKDDAWPTLASVRCGDGEKVVVEIRSVA